MKKHDKAKLILGWVLFITLLLSIGFSAYMAFTAP